VWVYGLQQTEENRSNLAIVNTGEADQAADTFLIEIFDGNTGTKAATVEGISLEARRWKQWSTILAEFAPGVSQGYARITKLSGRNPFIAYGVINDGGQPRQRSDDGAFIWSSP
jgi:hypothetical protein